jgi:hypothetical protein
MSKVIAYIQQKRQEQKARAILMNKILDESTEIVSPLTRLLLAEHDILL